MKKMTFSESRRLIWFTWLLAIFVGVVVYFSTDPTRWYGLGFAGVVLLGLLINFFVKLRRIPNIKDKFLQKVFSRTAVLALFMCALTSKDGTLNSLTLALVAIAIVNSICILPEVCYSE